MMVRVRRWAASPVLRHASSCVIAVAVVGGAAVAAPATEPAAAPQVGQRSEELLERRRARLAALEEKRPSRVVETLATVENRGFDRFISFQRGDFRFGFGKISPISSLAPAVRWARPSIGGTRIKARAAGAVSVLGYQAYAAQLGVFDQVVPPDYAGDGFLGAPFEFDDRSSAVLGQFIYANAGWRRFPREEFFGLGPDSALDDRSAYEYTEGTAEIVAGIQPVRWFALQARAGWVGPAVTPSVHDDLPPIDAIFDAATAPGLGQDTDFARIAAAMFLSWEGDPSHPAVGTGLRYTRFEDLGGGDEFTFDRVSWDVRAEVPIWSRQRRIATRIFASSDFPGAGSEVPFYLMRSLGGPDRLRGYRSLRFRDRHLLLLSAEYRWEANPAVELAVFYDAGNVFADLSDRSFSDLESTWGVGLRFKNARRTSLRLELGRSDEGTRFFFSFGPAF